jgi:hypothetical protein
VIGDMESQTLHQQFPMLVSPPELVPKRVAHCEVPTSDQFHFFVFDEEQLIHDRPKLCH